MSLIKNMIVAFLIVIAVCVTVSLFQKGYTTWGVMCVAGLLLYIYEKIEANKISGSNDKRPLCYRIRLGILPNWKAILPIPYEELEREYEKLEIDKEKSLIGKEFSCVIFNDEFSGLYQIWSNYYKTFVDEIEVRGFIIEGDLEQLFQKYNFQHEKLSEMLVITPNYIGYPAKNLPDKAVLEEGKIARIPFGGIIHHLKNLYRVWGNAMNGIIKFPEELQKEFDKYKVKYETGDNEDYGTGLEFKGEPIENKYAKYPKKVGFEISTDRMRSHIFTTTHYSISINIEFFDRIDE